MTRTLFTNARLLDPASGLDVRGALLVEGERIARLGPGIAAGDATVIDCAGACLAPGLVDMRVQLREPGDEHLETLHSGALAAAAGGVTAMVCLPNTNPVIDQMSLVEFIGREARRIGLVKIYAYAAATKGLQGRELTEMGLLALSGAVGFSDGVRAIANARVMRHALSYAAAFGRVVVQHPEEPSLASPQGMNEGEIATRLGLPGIPADAEAMMVERDLRLAALTGGRVHFAHVSTAAAVEAIRQAKARGVKVSCDTAPPYFALNELAVGDYRSFAKLSPPLRAEPDRLAVVAGIADGTIDAIASDHAPFDQDAKRQPFAQAEPGGVGLETLLSLTLGLVHQGAVPLLTALKAVTAAPAAILGLPVGRLAVGGPADLVIFDPDQPGRVDPATFRSKCRNTPFDGHLIQGRVLRTVVNGRSVFAAG